MIQVSRRGALALGLAAATAGTARAEKKYAPGVTDSEILIGSTQPFSGPASSYSTIGRCHAAYFGMLNEQGGINGRKIKLIQLDDAYTPPKTVEQTRKLVEQEKVAFIFAQLGTPTGMSTRKYLNQHKIPDVFVASGATQFFDHANFPWVIGWQPSYQIEGRIYAKYILQTKPDAKVAVLSQNDDSGRDLMKGMRDGLGDKAEKMLVSTTTYETTDPTTDSQVLSAKGSGADVFFFAGIPKFSAMTIRKVYDMGWKPLFIVSNPASSVATALVPAGLDKSVGLITSAYMKDSNDPQWETDKGYKDWRAFMAKYYPDGDIKDSNVVYGYSQAQCLEQVLRSCGDDLSRENIMNQAWHIDFQPPMFQPGVPFSVKPGDLSGIKKLRLVRFDGKAWVPFGEAIGA
ncbi:MAG: ABC transporter substrate-binding protein [Alphaproteobacteria bacterium]|nr:ABC transporter substrate-binding protein [Alphaproteobacteria bacterium]